MYFYHHRHDHALIISARHVGKTDDGLHLDLSKGDRHSLARSLTFPTITCLHHCVSLPAMTRTVGPLLLLLLTLSVLCAAVSSTTPPSASLYLHPAAPGNGRPVDISAVQANRVLAHLLNIPSETLGAGAGHRDAWDWMDPTVDPKEAVKSLFVDSKQRSVVLFTDLDTLDAQGECHPDSCQFLLLIII